jgi:hypothetical protein
MSVFGHAALLQIDDCIKLWAALDALVLKAVALVLNYRLDLPPSCYHVAGKEGEEQRGAKAAVRHICSSRFKRLLFESGQ